MKKQYYYMIQAKDGFSDRYFRLDTSSDNALYNEGFSRYGDTPYTAKRVSKKFIDEQRKRHLTGDHFQCVRSWQYNNLINIVKEKKRSVL